MAQDWEEEGKLVAWFPGVLPRRPGSARPQAPASPVPLSPAPGRRGSVALVSEIFEQHLGGHILQSLDGFVFALSQEGKFLYISETVSIYLGLSQVELTGSSVFDYIHPGDHSEVLEQLGLRARTSGPPTPPSIPSSSSSSSSLADTPEIEASPTEVPPSSRAQERSFFVRMKSTLTKRGLHVKASGYKLWGRGCAPGGPALPHPLSPAPAVGKLDVLDKGQVVTGYYRWLQRAGGFVWLQSVATVAVSGKSPGERHVLWVSYVLSQAEGGHTPLDAFQLPASAAREDASSPEPEPAAKRRAATHPWTPSSFQPARPARTRPAQSQNPQVRLPPDPGGSRRPLAPGLSRSH
ncbi:Neuronal PAS domain-containing protein 1 [Myotis davidii]|uniref:Neuronal PAS domain-containing protein 1 n=1 Tax=Myotis davidii TaxID=225400 RepID=L5LCF4_MYODS|nr:Neuronal PAS domain-containing protein 1 [Myotis davidii]